jgi:pimeloyl-ACP methyl ester carboxylesterase
MSGSPSTSARALTGEEDTYPLVLVHGISDDPVSAWTRVDSGLKGRTIFPEAYADDLAALPPGSVSRSAVFAVGYYKRRSADAPYFNGKGSIGGCPLPRTDGFAGDYSVAFVDCLGDAVEAILRATGAPRVDLVGSSMGGIVTRAYIKWRSGRGPGGESRVRRYLVFQSPGRGLNDLEAFMQCLDSFPFQCHGEVAEMARDYPGWSGQSYIDVLNDGWDAWCQARGVTYGGMFGTGCPILNQVFVSRAVDDIQQVLSGGIGGGSIPSIPGISTSGGGLALVQEAAVFIDPSRFDLWGDLQESFTDGDGLVRASAADLRAGPEFPSALFSLPFHGTHVDRGQPDETMQYALHTRELIRRFLLEARLPRGASLVQGSVQLVTAPGTAGWLQLDYELAGSDGVSVLVDNDDETLSQLHQAVSVIPLAPVVTGAPAFEGTHRIRVESPAGQRVVTVRFYDADGEVGEIGPLTLDVPSGTAESAPKTSVVTLSPFTVTSNGAGAEFSWRLVGPKDVGAWSAWSSSNVIPAVAPEGTWELFVRSRHAANAAGVLVEEADPLELGLRVDGAGNATLRP